MALINNNGFILGALAISVMYGTHAANCLLCMIYRIRILQFSFFFMPFFKLHRRMVNGIEFSLGWLPLGGYVKPLGYQMTADEMNEVKPEDRPYAVFSKPEYLKVIFPMIPFIVVLLAMLMALPAFRESSLASSVSEISRYVVTAVRAIFTDRISDQDFAAKTLAIAEGSNVIALALILILIMVCFSAMLNTLIIALASTGGEIRGAKMVLMTICYLLFFWVFFWKIPVFFLSFVSLSQALGYLTSFVAGAFVTGAVLYFSTILVVMLFPGRAVPNVEVFEKNEQA